MHPYKIVSPLIFIITALFYINAHDLIWPNPETEAGYHFYQTMQTQQNGMLAYASKQGALETVCMIVMLVCAVQWLIGIWVERDKVEPIQFPSIRVKQTSRPAELSEDESADFQQWLEEDDARSYLSKKDQLRKFRAQRS
ncbi:hypothetical protein [Rubritalea marina]|uniref:hypothetical protein n=1 Tax=Rubritalea marina TaxID=361055 RepID=UPI00036DFCDD|nr:hypothetical protein [Rubritalea marina]